MDSICRLRVLWAVIVVAGMPGGVMAAMIHPTSPNDGNGYYPMVAGSRGLVDYQYDATTQTGLLALNNTPYVVASGVGKATEYFVSPDSMNTLHQIMTAELNASGQVIASAGNQYELRGRIEIGGQVYDGVLLHGRVTGVGSQSLDAVGIKDTNFFDARIAIDGGLLASSFGTSLYLRFFPTIGSTFTGQFDESFHGENVQSLGMSESSNTPVPIPEPLSASVLSLGLVGWLAWRRRHARRSQAA